MEGRLTAAGLPATPGCTGALVDTARAIALAASRRARPRSRACRLIPVDAGVLAVRHLPPAAHVMNGAAARCSETPAAAAGRDASGSERRIAWLRSGASTINSAPGTRPRMKQLRAPCPPFGATPLFTAVIRACAVNSGAMSVLVSALITALAARSGKTHERWAVITGASSGIGSAIALEASRRGYSVILAARRHDKLLEVADEAVKAGAPAALVVQCDLGTNAGRSKLMAATRSRPLSMAVVNAGFAYGGKFVKQDPKSVDEMVALNVGSVAALTRQFAERMTLQGGGRILLTGSISGAPSGALATTSPVTPWRCRSACPARACPVSPPLLAPAGVPNAALYGATKGFVRSFCAGIRPELSPSGVLVTCLLPGATDTGFAAAAGLESSSVFALPGMRALGMVLPASMVAAAALDAAEAGRAEVVPGLLNKGFVLFCALTPSFVGRAIAAIAFGESPLGAHPKTAPNQSSKGTVARLRGGCASMLGQPLVLLPLATLLAILVHVWQNGPASHPPPSCATAVDILALRRKADVVALWRASPAPAASRAGSWAGKKWRGHLLSVGVLAPPSAFLTHVCFGPLARWTGKAFAADGCSGVNTFAHGGPRRAFRASISPSALDGQPALVLDYRAAGEPLWGTVAGMRDELRQVMPGVLIGMGGMGVTGGVRNAAPFILVREE